MNTKLKTKEIETRLKEALAHSLKKRVKYAFEYDDSEQELYTAHIYLDGAELASFGGENSTAAATDFLDAARRYFKTEITAATRDKNPLTRAFAVADKDLPMATLRSLNAEKTENEPAWLLKLLSFRVNVEGILYDDFTY